MIMVCIMGVVKEIWFLSLVDVEVLKVIVLLIIKDNVRMLEAMNYDYSMLFGYGWGFRNRLMNLRNFVGYQGGLLLIELWSKDLTW